MNAHVNNTFEVFFRALPVKAREVAIIEIPVILHYKIVLLTFGDFLINAHTYDCYELLKSM